MRRRRAKERRRGGEGEEEETFDQYFFGQFSVVHWLKCSPLH